MKTNQIKVTAISASVDRLKHPSLAECDHMPMLWHNVLTDADTYLYIYATDPMDAIDKANRILSR